MSKVDMATLVDCSKVVDLVEPRTTGVLLSLGSGIFVTIGLFMIQDPSANPQTSWGALIFFGLCLVVGLMKLFGSSDVLRLDEDGFSYTSLGRVTRIQWGTLASIKPITLGLPFIGQRVVGFNFLDKYRQSSANFARSISGSDAAMPSAYGVKAKVLAAAMQKRLEHSRLS
jgi:hypothetical protein